MENDEIGKQIIELSGGKDNITRVWHCMTRLRFNLSDKSKVDIESINNLQGILKSQFQGEQFQLIIGNNVSNIYNAVKENLENLGDID